MKRIAGKWALVTGASSGIGWNFAEVLAERGCNLVLVARREERLAELAGKLQEIHGTEVRVIAQDLSAKGAAQAVFEKVRGFGVEIDILVNNAGYGINEDFLEIPWEREENMLRLLVLALTEMTKLFAGEMVKRGFGRVLLVGSTGSFQPTPRFSSYAAAKSYVLNFGVAVGEELRGTGVSVSVLCPGVTTSEFHAVSGASSETAIDKMSRMSARAVAEIGVQGMLKGRAVIVPGFVNSFNAFLMSKLSRRLAARLAGWATRAKD